MDKMDFNKKRMEHWFYMLLYGAGGLFILAIIGKAIYKFLTE